MSRTTNLRLVVFLMGLLGPYFAHAQFVQDYTIGKNAFAFHGNVNGKIRTFKSDQEALDVVANVVQSIGLPLKFEVRSGAVDNASAILTPKGKRLIVYNVIFMENIKKQTQEYWSLISIMAHEVGHHLSFHMSTQVDDHVAELEADYFSGFILGKLGATLDQALSAMRALGSPLPSKTHPKRDDRLQAIAVGWKTAQGNKTANPSQVQTSLRMKKESLEANRPTSITRDEIAAYLSQQYLNDQEIFAETVDYYDKGLVSRDFVRTDKANYAAKWPIRRYELVPGSLSFSTRSIGLVEVTFGYKFEVRNGSKIARGRGQAQITLKVRDRSFIVTKVRELVVHR